MIDSSASSHRSDNLVERLRFQFETYGDSRTFTFLHESGRTLVEEVAAFATSTVERVRWLLG